MSYTDEQLKHLEARLLRERERAVRSMTRFDEEFGGSVRDDVGVFSLHMADEGTDTNQREKAFLLASEHGRRLLAIDAALRRLYRSRDQYGRCSGCGDDVGFDRLDAIPWAETCIACQNQRENE